MSVTVIHRDGVEFIKSGHAWTTGPQTAGSIGDPGRLLIYLDDEKTIIAEFAPGAWIGVKKSERPGG